MSLDPGENKLYSKASDLHPHHWERLAARPPEEAACAAGAEYVGGRFRLAVAGSPLIIDPIARTVAFAATEEKEPGYQRALVAVAYLADAIDAPLAGKMVSPRELPGGQGFFRGPHAVPSDRLARAFGADIEGFSAAAARLGGARLQGGDASSAFPLLPKIPAQVILWRGDEEMAAQATVLVDARAHLFVPLDVLWAALNVLVGDLTR